MALNPRKKIPFKLAHRKDLSHNTRLFRFALQTPETKLGLPVGQHMFFYAKACPCRRRVQNAFVRQGVEHMSIVSTMWIPPALE